MAQPKTEEVTHVHRHVNFRLDDPCRRLPLPLDRIGLLAGPRCRSQGAQLLWLLHLQPVLLPTRADHGLHGPRPGAAGARLSGTAGFAHATQLTSPTVPLITSRVPTVVSPPTAKRCACARTHALARSTA